jgi:hypothetical protein
MAINGAAQWNKVYNYIEKAPSVAEPIISEASIDDWKDILNNISNKRCLHNLRKDIAKAIIYAMENTTKSKAIVDMLEEYYEKEPSLSNKVWW